jgi:transcriptional antiterminator RfaH
MQPANLPPHTTSHTGIWYVVHTKPRQESRAAANLWQQGFEAYLPLLKTETLRLGKVYLRDEPLFKRYIFVRFDALLSPWHSIRSTLGVHQLLRFGDQLASVPDSLIASLKSIDLPSQSLYQKGDVLRVKDGPFKQLEVIYDLQDGDSRAIVLIDLLNKTHKVALNLNLLTLAG